VLVNQFLNDVAFYNDTALALCISIYIYVFSALSYVYNKFFSNLIAYMPSTYNYII